jgi:hypothetical protein
MSSTWQSFFKYVAAENENRYATVHLVVWSVLYSTILYLMKLFKARHEIGYGILSIVVVWVMSSCFLVGAIVSQKYVASVFRIQFSSTLICK